MVDKLAPKADRALLWVGLLLALPALLAGSLPAGATLPSWDEVTAVNREGLEAAARKYFSPQEVELLQQAISKGNWRPRHPQKLEPPLMELKNRQFLHDLLDIVNSCLARGDSAKVKQFFQVVNQRKLIRGYGISYYVKGSSGGRMVIQLELRQSPQKEFQVEVWYRMVHPGIIDGKKKEGSRYTYPTGITGP
jgi:hypothetical protein